jgi:hypothetical protein
MVQPPAGCVNRASPAGQKIVRLSGNPASGGDRKIGVPSGSFQAALSRPIIGLMSLSRLSTVNLAAITLQFRYIELTVLATICCCSNCRRGRISHPKDGESQPKASSCKKSAALPRFWLKFVTIESACTVSAKPPVAKSAYSIPRSAYSI